jgi:DNA-binding protein H-NS
MADELKNIERQIAQLQAKRQTILKTKRGDVLKDMKTAIATYGFSAAELGLKERGNGSSPKAGSSKAKPKYQNPTDPSQTWSGGRGRVPLWIKEHEVKGGSREDFLINRP